MFEFCQQVLLKVSFDRVLFRKELIKMIGLLKRDEVLLLKAWCLITFVQYQDVIAEVYSSS
jgi:hypothetical protein